MFTVLRRGYNNAQESGKNMLREGKRGDNQNK